MAVEIPDLTFSHSLVCKQEQRTQLSPLSSEEQTSFLKGDPAGSPSYLARKKCAVCFFLNNNLSGRYISITGLSQWFSALVQLLSHVQLFATHGLQHISLACASLFQDLDSKKGWPTGYHFYAVQLLAILCAGQLSVSAAVERKELMSMQAC